MHYIFTSPVLVRPSSESPSKLKGPDNHGEPQREEGRTFEMGLVDLKELFLHMTILCERGYLLYLLGLYHQKNLSGRGTAWGVVWQCLCKGRP